MHDELYPPDGGWVRAAHAARWLGVSPRTLGRLIRQGRLVARRRSRHYGRRYDEILFPPGGVLPIATHGPCLCFGYVYVVRRQNGLCKIGRSSAPEVRIRGIETTAGELVQRLAVTPVRNHADVETALHRRFQTRRQTGEWFSLSESDIKEACNFILEQRAEGHIEGCTMSEDAPDIPDSMIGEVIENDSDGEWEWLSPPVAAQRVGVSERTLWRMIKAGRYHRRTERGRAEVRVPSPDKRATVSGLALPATPDALSLAVIEELRRQHGVAEERLTRQTDRIAALERENGKLEAALEAAEQRLTEAREQAARSWWRKWWGGRDARTR